MLYFCVTSFTGNRVMPNVTLRAVGGSVVVALPKPSLQELNLRAGSRVRLAVEHGKVTRLKVTPKNRTKDVVIQSLP